MPSKRLVLWGWEMETLIRRQGARERSSALPFRSAPTFLHSPRGNFA